MLTLIYYRTFHGNSESALSQVYTGINLLHDYSNKCGREAGDFLRWKTAAPGIEQDIVSALHLLKTQGMSFLNHQPVSYHNQWYHASQAIIDGMPSVFVEYEEARYYKELLLARGW